jgi:hypothetical protein
VARCARSGWRRPSSGWLLVPSGLGYQPGAVIVVLSLAGSGVILDGGPDERFVNMRTVGGFAPDPELVRAGDSSSHLGHSFVVQFPGWLGGLAHELARPGAAGQCRRCWW